MKRIDFLGAPGVGKTTIYKELVKRRTKSDQWMTPEEAKRKVASIYLKQNAKSIKDYLIAALLKIDLFKKIHPRFSSRVLNKYQYQIIWTEKEHYANFLEAALQCSTLKEIMPLMRVSGIAVFYSEIKDIILLEHSKIPGLVLFDESLSNKIYSVTLWRKGFFEQATNDYFNTIPLPWGIIYCKTNLDNAFLQLKNRKITMMGHRDLDDKLLLESIKAQFEIASIGQKVLKGRGVKIIEISTDDPMEKNIQIITSALRNDFV